MKGCPACDGVEGAAHTCPESGTFVAAEAHASGEIEELAEPWPNWDCSISLHLRAPDEQSAREHLTRLMGELLDDALAVEVAFSIMERRVGVGT